MPLRETLQTILTDYPNAKSEPLEGHALAQFIRRDAEAAVQQALEEGVAVTYEVAADFAVLCANCHRMIHRTDDPSNLSLFWENLASPKP